MTTGLLSETPESAVVWLPEINMTLAHFVAQRDVFSLMLTQATSDQEWRRLTGVFADRCRFNGATFPMGITLREVTE